MVLVGQTYLASTGNGNHLFIIVLGPIDIECYQKKQFLSVNVTSIEGTKNYDTACVIRAGEHPFIKHDSYVAYRFARLDSEQHLENLCKTQWIRKEDCSESLLKRMKEGLRKSREIPKYLKDILKE